MDCIKCGSKTIVAKKEDFHPPGDKYPWQRRLYVCVNELCGHSFYYKNTFMDNHEAFNSRRFIQNYDKNKQRGLFDDD